MPLQSGLRAIAVSDFRVSSIQPCQDFTDRIIPRLIRNALVFLNLPYIENGKNLYLDDYVVDEQFRISHRVPDSKRNSTTPSGGL